MRFYYGSDLHLEFESGETSTTLLLDNIEPNSTLLLAGDIFCPNYISEQHHELVDSFWADVSHLFQQVFIIAGNHEFYGGDFEKTHAKIRHSIRHYKNIRYLYNESVTVGDVAIFGSTLWTDLNGGSPVTEWDVRRNMNDYHQIKVGPERKLQTADTIFENKVAIAKLFDFFEDNKDKQKIIMTHHAPAWMCVEEQYSRDIISYAYANTGIDDMLLNNYRYTWIHGHMHKRSGIMITDTQRILTNARGYVGIEYGQDTDNYRFKYFEV